MAVYHLKTPLSKEDVCQLNVGDTVYLSGEIFTGRSRIHRYIFDENNVKEIFADIRANGYLLDCIVFNAANLGIGQVSLDVDMQEFMGVFQTNIGWNFMMARAAAELR